MKKVISADIFAIYFSPYTAHTIEIDGIVYPTVEHAYQCKRYTDKDIINKILQTRSPMLAWELSARFKHLTVPGFAENKLVTMKELMIAKVNQHRDVRDVLLGSGDLEIIKHITTYPPGDGFWDDGVNGEGMNHMGRLWMEIRDELRKR